jgi:hypothetical protein
MKFWYFLAVATSVIFIGVSIAMLPLSPTADERTDSGSFLVQCTHDAGCYLWLVYIPVIAFAGFTIICFFGEEVLFREKEVTST